MERPCPTCRKPARWEDNPNRPFCSERCRDRDLGRWAMEDYRVEAGSAETSDFDEHESGSMPEDFQPS